MARKKRDYLLLKALSSFFGLTILILAVSIYFVSNNTWIGPAFLVLGLINLILIKFFGIEIKTILPDFAFGAIDNGILVLNVVLGGIYAGIGGAIIGGAAGNALTDGIGGIVEGHLAEKQKLKKIDTERNSLSTMLGKMAGCLIGAGVGLVLVWIIRLIF